MKDLISIVIPVFNTEKYIKETVDSVLEQTHSNIEIILINDGSTDNSESILNEIKNKNPEKIILVNQANQGQTKARNNGADYATGTYLLFLDSDDKLEKTFLSKCISVLKQNNSKDLVYTKASFFDQKVGEWKLGVYEIQRFLKDNCIPITALISKETFFNLGKFDENINFFEDWELWIKLIKNGGKIHQIPENLFFYRQRDSDNSLTNAANKNTKILEKNKLYIYNKHYDLYTENNLGINILLENHRYKEKYNTIWYKKIFK